MNCVLAGQILMAVCIAGVIVYLTIFISIELYTSKMIHDREKHSRIVKIGEQNYKVVYDKENHEEKK